MNPIDLAGVGGTGSTSSGAGFELMLAALLVAMVTLVLGRKEPRRRR